MIQVDGPASAQNDETEHESATSSPHQTAISSDPLAMSDNDFSPVRVFTTLARSKTDVDHHPAVDDDGNEVEEQERVEYGPRPSRSSQPLPGSDSDAGQVLFDEAGRSSRLAQTETSDTSSMDVDPPLSALTTGISSVIVVDPARPGLSQSRDRSQPRRKGEPTVVIPLFPLSKIYSYAHPSSSSVPTTFSRRKLPMISSAASSSRSPSSIRITGAKRKRRVSGSSASYGLDHGDDGENVLEVSSDSEGEEEEEDNSGDTESEGSDGVALRRSRRGRAATTRKGKEREEAGRISERTRLRQPFTRRSISILSLDSENSEPSRQRRMTLRKMQPRPTARILSRRRDDSDEDQLQIVSSSSAFGEEESEVDELESESNFDDTSESESKNKRRGKKKPTRSGRKPKVEDNVIYNHRPWCEKCSRGPADDLLERALARKKKGNRKRKKDEDRISDEELAESLEGWLECNKCVVASHWGCLNANSRKEVLHMLLDQEGPPAPGEKPRRSVKIDESTKFTCPRCEADPKCFVCHEEKLLKPIELAINSEGIKIDIKEVDVNGDRKGKRKEKEKEEEKKKEKDQPEHEKMDLDKPDITQEDEDDEEDKIQFRCWRCKRCAHYEHLEAPASLQTRPRLAEIADHYQRNTEEGSAWICHDCREWVWAVDSIIAWRPSPADATEPALEPDEKANWKDTLPREYLVKWMGRGFRHVTWVPHSWLQITTAPKLRIFLEKGPSLDLVTDETLAARGDDMAQPTIANVMEAEDMASGPSRATHARGERGRDEWIGAGPGPEATARLPVEWSTIDRVLEVMLLPPPKGKKQTLQHRERRVLSVSASTSGRSSPLPTDTGGRTSQAQPSQVEETRAKLGVKDGIQPPPEMRMEIDEWERRSGRELQGNDVDEIAGLVSWCLVKWDDLQYDQSSWDTPPLTTSSLYPAYKRALARFLASRRVNIPVLSTAQCRQRDADAARAFVPPQEQPDCIVGGKLMPFQMEGFQWLLYKHFRRESCILADDMGLGKTIQIASVLGYLGSDEHHIYPSLVIVPNSTITNWVREFEKWVPHIRVVPYYGEAASRKIINKYELFHKGMQGKAAGLKAHIVLTTYDIITGSDFRVFANIPRWEVLCIDEGQRLKSDDSLIFNRLKTLNSVHRILMTGTPLNNNLRELFNLLNFLDPSTFKDLWDLEQRFDNLNEGLIQELHEMIKPYILRRIKADVLKLPPKIEIIVPISLSPLQKQVYKGIYEKNADVIQAILQARQKKSRAAGR
ncbi:hypothetical protein IAR55_002930 [Kwoniella newhampshirensis]|uniref:Helicase ATP-binding domain-containing protein n=1 Tax=Kwoniella newhampshirensis TaxID=1651941 RepID=A0AAW0YPC8_9TREE